MFASTAENKQNVFEWGILSHPANNEQIKQRYTSIAFDKTVLSIVVYLYQLSSSVELNSLRFDNTSGFFKIRVSRSDKGNWKDGTPCLDYLGADLHMSYFWVEILIR